MLKRQKEFKSDHVKRTWVTLDRVSRSFLVSIILGEDPSFCEHKGIIWKLFSEQVVSFLRRSQNRSSIGGSTISQQVAKNVFLYPKKDLFRKTLETYFTLMIEMIWGKKRILEVYVNVIEMGKNIFGIQAAALEFFCKDAKDLTVDEAIAIAGTLPNPLRYHVMNPTPYQMIRERKLKKILQHRQSMRIAKNLNKILDMN